MRICAFGLLVVAGTCVSACTSSSDGPDPAAPVLRGTYQAEGDGPIAALTFDTATHYFMWPSGCAGGACIGSGTYQLDIANGVLALTDRHTGETLREPFRIEAVDPPASGPIHAQTRIASDDSAVSDVVQKMDLLGGGGEPEDSTVVGGGGGQRLVEPCTKPQRIVKFLSKTIFGRTPTERNLNITLDGKLTDAVTLLPEDSPVPWEHGTAPNIGVGSSKCEGTSRSFPWQAFWEGQKLVEVVHIDQYPSHAQNGDCPSTSLMTGYGGQALPDGGWELHGADVYYEDPNRLGAPDTTRPMLATKPPNGSWQNLVDPATILPSENAWACEGFLPGANKF